MPSLKTAWYHSPYNNTGHSNYNRYIIFDKYLTVNEELNRTTYNIY